jgi:acetyl-CoA hydrolase
MARAGLEVAAQDLDLRRWIKPGDRVMWGQGSAEPLTLIRALVDQRSQLGGIRVYLSISFSRVLQPEHADHLSFEGFGGLGSHARLAKTGLIDVHPVHFSLFCNDTANGRFRSDVYFVQLSPCGEDGTYTLATDHGYSAGAIRHARTVIAEINENAPRVPGRGGIRREDIDVLVHSNEPLAEMPLAVPDDTDRAIARHVLPYIENRATIQVGVGGVPSAILDELRHHKDLGVHTGMLSDPILDLMKAGVITNAAKPVDAGVSVCCALYGTRRLYKEAETTPQISLYPGTYTHDPAVMAKLDQFISVNSAIEVDLSGQVNAEYVGRFVGGVGGQVDFVRGARAAARGRSIIVLRSRTGSGIPRIVAGLSGGTVTTARSDVDIIATEWGVAELADKTLRQRAKALIAIADPRDREALQKSLEKTL